MARLIYDDPLNPRSLITHLPSNREQGTDKAFTKCVKNFDALKDIEQKKTTLRKLARFYGIRCLIK